MVEPHPYTPIYTAVGIIIITWAQVEEFINDCVLFFYHQYSGHTVKSAKHGIPRTQLSRKLDFLCECLLTLPELSKYKEIGNLLICRSRTICIDRDNIIHSVIAGISPESILLVKHKYDRNSKDLNKPKLHSSEYTLTDLLSIGNKIQDLATDWIPYVQGFAKDQGIGIYYTQ
jgi:hypothetical protein